MELSTLHAYMPALRHVKAIQQIHKGFSFDAKYFLYESDERPSYVLRTAALRLAARKRGEFEAVERVFRHGIATSEPIGFGVIEPLEICFMVLRYVEGEDASERLPLLTADEQHRVGVAAGRELRLMHELDAPAGLEPWHERRFAKHERQMADYRSCGVKLPGEEAVIAFIEANAELMRGRPDRFQHDDFHPGNLLVHERQYSGAIDFNRYDWGDPYHDFLKIAYFSREVSIPFCIGQIDGYFEGAIPELFWRLYALYTAMIMLPTIIWTLQVVPKQLDGMLDRIRVVLDDHSNFESVVPAWYKP